MKTGLLWYDDNPHRTLQKKIARAAARHTQKYGHVPNVCYIHPSHGNGLNKVGPVQVKTLHTVLPYHFWIGQEEQSCQ